MWPNGYGPEWNSKNYNDPTPCYPDSDESDSDEMLPIGAFRPTPEEEEWTIVGKPHGVQRYNKDIDCNRLHDTRDKLDHSGMCSKQLDYIDWNVVQYDSVNTVDSDTRSEVIPIRRNEATQNDSSPSSSRNGPQSHRLTSEPVLTSVRPSFRKRLNVIAVERRKTAGVPTARPVDIVPTPQVIENESRCIGTVAREMFPEEPGVVPAKIAKEANTEGATNARYLHDDRTIRRRPLRNCPRTLLKFRDRRSCECLLKWPRRPVPMVLRMYSAYTTIRTIRRQPIRNCPRTLLKFRNRRSRECLLKWPRRPVPMVLRMNSAYTNIRTIRRRPLRNCPWIFLKYLNRRSREDSWNWPRRPGTFMLKMNSVFLWTKIYHK